MSYKTAQNPIDFSYRLYYCFLFKGCVIIILLKIFTETINMKPVSFYLVTDTHYFENNLGAGGKAFEKNAY